MIQPSLRPQLSLLAKTPKCDLSMWFELLLSMMARFQKQALSDSYIYISKERQKKREREREWMSMSNIQPLMTQPHKSNSIATSTSNPLSCWVWPSYKGRSNILQPLMEDSGISGRELGMRGNPVAFFGKYKPPCHIAMYFLDTTVRVPWELWLLICSVNK